jgi:hypothetical protein
MIRVHPGSWDATAGATVTEAEGAHMSSKRPWLIGCGIGCGAALLVAGIFAGGSYFFIKRTVRQAEDFSARVEEMNDRFGPVEEHRLPVDEVSRHNSVAQFLAVREELRDDIDDLEVRLGRLADRKGDGGFGPLDVLVLTKELPGLVSGLLDYLSVRTEVLLRNDMSFGEYLYLYAVIYYGELGFSPEDGPPFQLISEDDEDGQRWNRKEEVVRQERNQRIRAIVNDLALPMLRRQLEDAELAGEGNDEWREQLATEIARLEDYRSGMPWEKGLPPDLRGWVDDLRKPLEDSYSAMINPIEIGTYDQD